MRGSADTTDTRHIVSFDWLRAAGCVAVVALHVLGSVIALGPQGAGPVRYVLDSELAIACGRWAVPVFLMMTGALLLNPKKRLGWRDVWRYERRMLFVLVTFGLLFCLVESYMVHGELAPYVVVEAALNLLSARSWDHLWYVYALLVLYALTPALRALVRRCTQRQLAWLLVAYYVCALVLPTAADLAWDANIRTPANLVPAVFYYVLGHYVCRYMRLDRACWCAGLGSLAAMLVLGARGGEYLAQPRYCLVAPYAALVLLIFERYATAPVEGHGIAALLARCSFGIYVVHVAILHAINRGIGVLGMPAGIYEAFALLACVCGSVACTLALRRLPGFRDHL